MNIDLRFRQCPLDQSRVAAWAALAAAMETADHQDEFLSQDDLAEYLHDPGVDLPNGSLAIYDGGAMIGYALLGPSTSADPVHLMRVSGGVHPAFRGRGIGGYILDWSERTAPLVHADRFPGRPLSLSASCQESNNSAVGLFTGRGFRPSRWFLRMTCELTAEPAAAPVPAGVRVVRFTHDLSADARQVHDEAFRDHWGTAESSAEGWEHFIGYSAFRSQYSFLAYQGDEPLALVIAHDYDSHTQATGRRDLYIPTVGTRRAARGRGLATALLATALRAARADGFDTSTLDVDADSPTGAGRIYERAGYAVKDRRVTMVKDLIT